MKHTDALIDYLLAGSDDICGKCAYYIDHTQEEFMRAGDNELPFCKKREAKGFNSAIDCREGMKAWFKANA